jgi:predicted transcriptional regulator
VIYRWEIKQKILEFLIKKYPQDFSIGEIIKQLGIAKSIAFLWLRVLTTEEKVEFLRKVENAVYRFKREEHQCLTSMV